MSPSMTVLEIEGGAGGWHLHLSGDWSLAAMAQIEAQLDSLPDTLHGTLVCDWSRAEAPGIGPAWALLMRLSMAGTGHLTVRHAGDPPHYLELLEKLEAERHASRVEALPGGLARSVGKVGRWRVTAG